MRDFDAFSRVSVAIMSWLDLTSSEMVVSHAIPESLRFGMSVINIRCGSKFHNTDTLISELTDGQYDLAIVRYPSDNTEIANSLETSKFKILVTDPTVYWTSPRQTKAVLMKDKVEILEISEREVGPVIAVIESSFHEYQSHWHYNSKTKHIQMSEAYTEWLKNSLRDTNIHIFLMTYRDSKIPIGMAMIKISGNIIEVLLAGVSAAHQGKGLYGELLKYLINFGSVNGIQQLVISTQASNINVQKAWVKQQWNPAMTVQTMHVEKK